MAYQARCRGLVGHGRGRPIALKVVDEAREQLILHRGAHLDKLREPRVRRALEPLPSGGAPDGDLAYIRGLDRGGAEEGRLVLLDRSERRT